MAEIIPKTEEMPEEKINKEDNELIMKVRQGMLKKADNITKMGQHRHRSDDTGISS